jgi:hypothetical protein
MFQVQTTLSRLKGFEEPAFVAIQPVKAVWNRMACHQHQTLHGAQN